MKQLLQFLILLCIAFETNVLSSQLTAPTMVPTLNREETAMKEALKLINKYGWSHAGDLLSGVIPGVPELIPNVPHFTSGFPRKWVYEAYQNMKRAGFKYQSPVHGSDASINLPRRVPFNPGI
jgi:hypothetical protein